jgi:hypothetical protein
LKNLLIKTLHKVVGINLLRESGSLKYRVQQLSIKDALMLADSYFENKGPQIDAFTAGIELGRKAKQQVVFKVKLANYTLAFIGTEADIDRKLNAFEQTKNDAGGKDSTEGGDIEETLLKKVDETLKEFG